MTPEIRPCDDHDQFRRYIDTHWRRGHVLAHDPEMFAFTYATPWVDRSIFTGGVSVLGLYEGRELIGFLGAIVAPYPRPQSYWLALWHVLPTLKGGGHGGKLLARMQQIAESQDGWIGTFGAGPEALPVYLKRGYAVRAARRWLYDPQTAADAKPLAVAPPETRIPDLGDTPEWLKHRFHAHPRYTYAMRPGLVSRTEENDWGVVTHVCWLAADGAPDEIRAIHSETTRRARHGARNCLVDAWAFDCPGSGWTLAPDDVPSVFHPPQARGGVTYAVGRPFLPARIHKGDCDQDRPNDAETGDRTVCVSGKRE